ncbi:MAG TPA: SDR family NAD(P)-dependent oxidoreductase [Thermoanaerobaculia bacterium]|jgi:NAD(P)-dependent dehydrogenase (short-subunit alcohol dehydrogenase family)|nr:SDR family NAD(P)-dependent oxidoreductase [Thermoanaerobaculia bacterium]
MKTIDLSGRVALVTGASRGIGAVIARALGEAGARVAVHYGRHRDGAEAVARAIRDSGGPPPFVVGADLADEEARRRLYDDVAKHLGQPLVLVNNAGVYERNPFDEPDDAAYLARWRATMNVNLESAAHLSHLALPAMRRARFGRIVMISSRAAFRGETDCGAYAVSKAGMVALARSLARAEGKNGVTSNSICPGWVETEMAKADLASRADEIVSEIPLGRVAAPEDVAGAVLYLASELGGYVNGAALPLNGGSFLH